MLKRILLGFAALVVLVVVLFLLLVGRPFNQLARSISPHTAAADLAKQDDSVVPVPPLEQHGRPRAGIPNATEYLEGDRPGRRLSLAGRSAQAGLPTRSGGR